MKIPYSVLQAYGLEADLLSIESLGNGLINETWKVTNGTDVFVLQRINDTVFKDPQAIEQNIELIAAFLEKKVPGYMFIAPLCSSDGRQMVQVEEGYFRLFPFVPDSHSKEVVDNAAEAFEAAAQFGGFTKLLSGFDTSRLKITLPHFHDLTFRYNQFQEALQNGNRERLKESEPLISFINQQKDIVETYEFIKQSSDFKQRVTHHDTKISNILFDVKNKGLCVIDLDTVMPGFFISDVGDMLRTYLSPVSEEETDFNKIDIRTDIYRAIVRGYYEAMEQELSPVEKQYFFYAGKFMIYMQAMRFLTDYLNNDVYYGARYPGHNFNRAKNQVVLLEQLLKKEAQLTDLIPTAKAV